MLTDSLAGLTTTLALIAAIGAQNAFVLRQGLARRHVGTVVAICAGSDLVLICAGVAGLGVVLEHAAWLVGVMKWLGAAFLAGYGAFALWRAWRGDGSLDPARASAGSAGVVVATALALTWLNPHVYLDTVLMLGAIAISHGDGRWWFAAGACAGSLLWFSCLAYGAVAAHRWLATPTAWRVMDTLIGTGMLALAGMLVAHG